MNLPKRAVHDMRMWWKRFFPWLAPEERIRFGTVNREIAYRSGQPNEKQLPYFIKKYQLRAIISVRTSINKKELEIARAHGVRFIQIPVKGNRIPEPYQIQAFLEYIRNPQNRPFLIHCAHGRDRTGIFVFLYRVEVGGWPPRDAWKETLSFGHAAYSGRSPYREWTQKRYGDFGIDNITR